MKLQSCSQEQWEKLQALGYPTPPEEESSKDNMFPEDFSPCVALAFKWLRDIQNLGVDVETYKEGYGYSTNFGGHNEGYKTYEEAESAALDFCLTYLIKRNALSSEIIR